MCFCSPALYNGGKLFTLFSYFLTSLFYQASSNIPTVSNTVEICNVHSSGTSNYTNISGVYAFPTGLLESLCNNFLW